MCRNPFFSGSDYAVGRQALSKSIEIEFAGIISSRFMRDAPFVCALLVTEEHHESTHHDYSDKHGAAVLGGW